ncbi:MAG: nitroreductase [Rhodobacteraceae bacterium]|nr:nitroreductase [Paracoccaceae bacterium]MCY4249052.1 nitroreductase [Paracoccaceae bacterium]MCY4308036.1 nitroreductase [Paracoccaceae bacterium]
MVKSNLQDIVLARRSIRGYLPDPVPRPILENILQIARSAPSGANLQPGRFTVLTSDALKNLTVSLIGAIRNDRPDVSEYSYFPNPLSQHLLARKRATGFGLYDALNIAKRDIKARKKQFEHNYRFFGAPVGIVVSIDKRMGKGCFMDLGMAIQNLLIGIETEGLSSCGIGALANYGDLVHEHLNLPDEEIVVCGIAVGYADPENPVNKFKTPRIDLDEYSDFLGFD